MVSILLASLCGIVMSCYYVMCAGDCVTLPRLLKFVTGQSRIPPRGLTHKIRLRYHRGSNRLPTAECCFHILHLPVVHISFEDSMDEDVIGSGDRFLRE